MEKIKLALVGAGERGQNSYAPYALAHGYALEFVAVAEPIAARRESFMAHYNIPPAGCFETAEQLLAAPKTADAVLICTQDSQHYAYAAEAIRQGYHILLEKPISPSAKECLALQQLAEAHNVTVVVCHVLRYTKFFRTIKQCIDRGDIGDIVTITHTENVGYWHYAHSYVRGNWHSTAGSSPMILAKCCHDMDILAWLVGSRCESVSSYGGLRYFNAENAPEGAPARCLDGCPASAECPYYAPALYMKGGEAWPVSCLGSDLSPAGRERALREGPYGVCVFHNDNDVVDHQTASLRFENGVTVAFTMAAFSNACDRTIKIMGTKGELRASMEGNVVEVTRFGPGKMTGSTDVIRLVVDDTGHSGGDSGIMEEFSAVLRGVRPNTNTVAQSVHSHIMALACEESRLRGETVRIRDYEKAVLDGTSLA